MRGGVGLLDDLPMDEDVEQQMEKSYYEFVQPRFKAPSGSGKVNNNPASGGVGG